jgi:hypothetical protein
MSKTYQIKRWSLSHAAGEFGIDRRTLTNRLRAAGIAPGPDAMFTTLQICSVLYDDRFREELGKIKAERERIQLQNRQTLGQLVDVAAFEKRYAPILTGMRSVILSSELPEEAKDRILNRLAGVLR